MRARSIPVWLLAILQLWLAHAIGFMAHEYAHSFTAWLLHAKRNPLDLNYGSLNLNNILFQEDVDENVNYAPLFAGGRDLSVSLIAIAGVLIGNGTTYLGSRFLLRAAERKRRRAWAMFFFWICVMSVGNFLSYVPVRTFATHADMATTAQGLHVRAWVIAVGLGIPFGIAIWHFFARILPDAESFLFGEEPMLAGVLVLMTTYFIFVFFGGSGVRNYGSVSHWLSVASMYVLFPVATIVCLQRSPGRAEQFA